MKPHRETQSKETYIQSCHTRLSDTANCRTDHINKILNVENIVVEYIISSLISERAYQKKQHFNMCDITIIDTTHSHLLHSVFEIEEEVKETQ